MDLTNLNSAQMAGFGGACALGGSILTKLIGLLSKKMDFDNIEGTQLRRELIKRCERLEQDIIEIRKEINHWQDRYYKETAFLKEELTKIKVELAASSVQLKDVKERDWIPHKDKKRYE